MATPIRNKRGRITGYKPITKKMASFREDAGDNRALQVQEGASARALTESGGAGPFADLRGSGNQGGPQGGQGTKPGSSRDDTANKIVNDPRKQEATLSYPEGIGNSKQDKIKFSALEYKPAGSGLISPAGTVSKRYDGESGNKKSLIDIYLPIPQDINSANTAGWSENDFSAVYAALFQVSKGTAESGMGDKTVDGVRQEVTKALRESGLMGKEGIELLTTKIGSEAANALTDANISMDNLLARQSGVIINPNKELLFNSVSLREFGFSFVFTARSQTEADSIRKIIRAFKKYSAPKTGSTGFFLASPDVFQISYLYNGNDSHPFLNKFKVAALKSVNVTYTGSSTYSTYEDGTPTHIIMSLAFSEIEPVYYEDFVDETGTGY
jgi:hypothetical protein